MRSSDAPAGGCSGKPGQQRQLGVSAWGPRHSDKPPPILILHKVKAAEAGVEGVRAISALPGCALLRKPKTEYLGAAKSLHIAGPAAVLIPARLYTLMSLPQAACGPRGYRLSLPEIPDPGTRGSNQPLRAGVRHKAGKLDEGRAN
jgi:hypothetical protein